MSRSIAITGSSGYIGRMLVERLTDRDEVEKVAAIDVADAGWNHPKVETWKMDVRDPAIGGALEGCDTVVHLAFIVAAINDVDETYSINLGGTRNVLSACEDAGIDKLVAASSMAAYGVQERSVGAITEDTPLRGDSGSYYLHTKRLVEEDLDVFEKRNPEVVVTRLRPSILLGPRNNNFAHEMGRFPFEVNVLEGATLPVVHEEDVVDAFELAVFRDAPGAFNISFEEPIDLSALGALMKGRQRRVSIGIDALNRISAVAYALRLTKLSPDWVYAARGNWRCDISRAREVLGWTPKRDLELTLQEMRDTIKGMKLSNG